MENPVELFPFTHRPTSELVVKSFLLAIFLYPCSHVFIHSSRFFITVLTNKEQSIVENPVKLFPFTHRLSSTSELVVKSFLLAIFLYPCSHVFIHSSRFFINVLTNKEQSIANCHSIII